MDAKHNLKLWNAFDGCARFLLYPDGKLLGLCDLAREVVGAQAGVTMRGGMIWLRDAPLCEAQLAAALGDKSIGLLHRQEDRLILGSFKAYQAGEQRVIALMLRLVTTDDKPDFACLGEAFHLTPTEEAVALQLLRGSSPAEIARTDHVSINTVRCHIAHIYSKLEARNREEMWVKCAPFAIKSRSRNFNNSTC